MKQARFAACARLLPNCLRTCWWDEDKKQQRKFAPYKFAALELQRFCEKTAGSSETREGGPSACCHESLDCADCTAKAAEIQCPTCALEASCCVLPIICFDRDWNATGYWRWVPQVLVLCVLFLLTSENVSTLWVPWLPCIVVSPAGIDCDICL